MNTESVVDDVKARLARVRGERPQVPYGDGIGERPGPREPEGLRLDLQDLDTIARRHRADGYAAGKVDGFREGHASGTLHGGTTRHSQDMQTLAAVAGVLRERLERIPDRLSAPATGARDARTKDELRQEAIDLVDEIRACFGVLLGGIVRGVFDEGS